MLKLYNSLTKKIEEFKPIKHDDGYDVWEYDCGPTVYSPDHIGHMWRYLMSDLARRVLAYNGFSVKQVMNITDVGHLTSDADAGEDKMLLGAKREHKTPWEIADHYTAIFMENRKKMNFLEPSVVCKATDHIAEQIGLIKKLEEKGFAYQISDGVYFDVSKFPAYGKLSGNTLDKLKAGARLEVNEEKRNPADFALWRLAKPEHIMQWDSPWGRGFPGWHIECSAMSMKYLGETLDIHSGGEDNKFPHHDCEIAQSESATGKPFVRIWMHSQFLKVEGQKMSKSLGNLYTISDIEKKGFNPLSLRYLYLTAHYRTPLNFTWEGLEAAQSALNKLQVEVASLGKSRVILTLSASLEVNSAEACPPTRRGSLTSTKGFLDNLPAQAGLEMTKRADDSCVSSGRDNDTKIAGYKKKFLGFVNDDLNLPAAVALVWELLKDKNIGNTEKYELLLNFDKVLGLRLDEVKKIETPDEVKKLVGQREEARKQKDFGKSDTLRKEIEKLGFKVEDKVGVSEKVTVTIIKPK